MIGSISLSEIYNFFFSMFGVKSGMKSLAPTPRRPRGGKDSSSSGWSPKLKSIWKVSCESQLSKSEIIIPISPFQDTKGGQFAILTTKLVTIVAHRIVGLED